MIRPALKPAAPSADHADEMLTVLAHIGHPAHAALYAAPVLGLAALVVVDRLRGRR